MVYSVIHVIRQMITYLGTGAGEPPPSPPRRGVRFPPLIVEYPEKNSNRCLLTSHFFLCSSLFDRLKIIIKTEAVYKIMKIYMYLLFG